MKFLKTILSSSLFITAFIGDYIVFKSKYSDSFVFRALADSFVHGFIGFLSSVLFFNYKIDVSNTACVTNIIFCTAVSSAIDIDHAFVAKSIHLKDYTNLTQRGIFHCTTFWIMTTTLLLTYSYLSRKFNIYILTFMLILAFTSHHVRDGNRRGLWIYPYSHTPPLNKFLYATLLAVIPNISAYLFLKFKTEFKDVVIDYVVV